MMVVMVFIVMIIMTVIDAYDRMVVVAIRVVIMSIYHDGSVMMVAIVIMVMCNTNTNATRANIDVLSERRCRKCDRKTKNRDKWCDVFHIKNSFFKYRESNVAANEEFQFR